MEGREWLRVRGIGRERFAGYLESFLVSLGYRVERSETVEPSESWLSAELTRMNPAVPEAGKRLRFRFFPTSGGAGAVWVEPTEVPPAELPRLDRLAREIVAHLERAVSTESHATAKVTRPPTPGLPWQPAGERGQ